MTVEHINYDELDPGIRETVQFLREHGFDTTDSGDGRSKFEHGNDCDCSLTIANVAIQVDPDNLAAESKRLKSLLEMNGLRVQSNNTSAADAMQAFEDGRESEDIGDFEPKNVEIAASYDPVDDIAVILVTGIDDVRLRAAKLRFQ